jgi:hypothetical protein
MEEYIHLLIPSDSHFVPIPRSIADFLSGVVRLGVVPKAQAELFIIQNVAPEVRRGKNPFTGEVLEIRLPLRRPKKLIGLENLHDLVQHANGVPEYDVRVTSLGLPHVAPLPIDFAKPYTLTVSCHIRAQTVAMCDLHEETGPVRFGENCGEADVMGLFTHPRTLQVIEVPGAGCARFWIEIGLGKFLCPRMDDGNLAIVHPEVMALASECFAISFHQGCLWC